MLVLCSHMSEDAAAAACAIPTTSVDLSVSVTTAVPRVEIVW